MERLPGSRNPGPSRRDAFVRINLLGPFEVWAGGDLIIDHRWRHRKAKSLLKLLALERGRALNREQLLETLWPGMEPAAAGNNLRKGIHRLRTTLGPRRGEPSVIQLRDRMVVLCDDVSLDIDEFRSRADAARGDPANRDRYEQALTLYRGDLLVEDLYEDWSRARRFEMRDLRSELLIGLSRVCERQGELGQARECLHSLLQSDPLDEEAHRCLMRVYASSGNRHRAERQYETCRNLLKRELGVDPSPETDIVHRQVLEGSMPLSDSRPSQ